MPNFATTWEVGEKIFETIPWEQPWAALLKYQCRDPIYFTCYPQNRRGVKEIWCLTWPLAVLLLVIIIKELLSEPIHRLCYYFYDSSISWSTSYCNKLQAEYMEALTFVTRHNRPFWTKRILIIYIWMNENYCVRIFLLLYIKIQICYCGFLVQLNKSSIL